MQGQIVFQSGAHTIPNVTFFPNDPEAPLGKAILAGDQAAFALLMVRLETRVYRFILKQIPNPSDAEDLTQDTFIEVFRKLPTFRGASKLSTWILGIALNIARNHRNRAPQHKYHWVDTEVLDGMAAKGATPHQQTETADFAKAVQSAMDSLPPDLREAMSLVSLDGLSYEDAALVADAPVGTMKNRVFRGRKAMREHLKRAGKSHLLEP